MLVPLCLEGGETVLDPNLGGKDEKSKRKLPLGETAEDRREEKQKWLCTGALSKGSLGRRRLMTGGELAGIFS